MCCCCIILPATEKLTASVGPTRFFQPWVAASSIPRRSARIPTRSGSSVPFFRSSFTSVLRLISRYELCLMCNSCKKRSHSAPIRNIASTATATQHNRYHHITWTRTTSLHLEVEDETSVTNSYHLSFSQAAALYTPKSNHTIRFARRESINFDWNEDSELCLI